MKISKWEELDKVVNGYHAKILHYYQGRINVVNNSSDYVIFSVDTEEVPRNYIIKFLKEFGFDVEFIELPKLSKMEYHLVNILHEGWWLARDMSLYAFESKPIKTNSGYYCGQMNDDYMRIPKDIFPFITPDRAWSVKELRELGVSNDD